MLASSTRNHLTKFESAARYQDSLCILRDFFDNGIRSFGMERICTLAPLDSKSRKSKTPKPGFNSIPKFLVKDNVPYVSETERMRTIKEGKPLLAKCTDETNAFYTFLLDNGHIQYMLGCEGCENNASTPAAVVHD